MLLIALIFDRIILHHIGLPQILYDRSYRQDQQRICRRHDCCHWRSEEDRCDSRWHDLLYHIWNKIIRSRQITGIHQCTCPCSGQMHPDNDKTTGQHADPHRPVHAFRIFKSHCTHGSLRQSQCTKSDQNPVAEQPTGRIF